MSPRIYTFNKSCRKCSRTALWMLHPARHWHVLGTRHDQNWLEINLGHFVWDGFVGTREMCSGAGPHQDGKEGRTVPLRKM